MDIDIICNLVAGRLGRSSINQRRPQFFYGQTSILNFYFEDYPSTGTAGEAPDGYADGLVNVNHDAQALVIKVGQRGGTPIVTANTWGNLPTAVSISQSYANHKMVYAFTPTPVKGYYTVAATASASYGESSEYPAGAAAPPLVTYTHTIFRDSTSGKIFADSFEGDIEDAIRAMLHEIVAGVGGSNITSGKGINGVPNSNGSFETYSWLGYALSQGVISPIIVAEQVNINEYNVQFYVPDFSQTVQHVFTSNGLGQDGIPNSDGMVGDYEWATVNVLKKGTITIDTLAIASVNLEGPRGKTGSIPFTDAQFATLLGSNNQVELWMEVLLDNKTVAQGAILVNKPMP